MRKLIQHTWFLFLVSFLVAGCASMAKPETLTERLAAMEISYQEALKTATTWRKEGRLSEKQIADFNDAFDEYELYRNAAKAAVNLGDLAEAEDSADKVAVALAALRVLVQEAEQ